MAYSTTICAAFSTIPAPATAPAQKRGSAWAIRASVEFTTAGTRKTSGNGSLMRNAPVALFFHADRDAAERAAHMQSKTTHQGDEAAECCRLLTHILVSAIHDSADADAAKARRILDAAAATFITRVYSVACLAHSAAEERCADNATLNLRDRQWTWKEDTFTYSARRAREQPGYIGSYSMDGLAMALHCVYTTTTFRSALLKAANLRGDADTVCAITGQLAGAIYGESAIPRHWIRTVQLWDVPNMFSNIKDPGQSRERTAIQQSIFHDAGANGDEHWSRHLADVDELFDKQRHNSMALYAHYTTAASSTVDNGGYGKVAMMAYKLFQQKPPTSPAHLAYKKMTTRT
jgi:ADP-ribosylglycohydrolase